MLGQLLSGSLSYTWPRTSSLMLEEESARSMPEAREGLRGEALAWPASGRLR